MTFGFNIMVYIIYIYIKYILWNILQYNVIENSVRRIVTAEFNNSGHRNPYLYCLGDSFHSLGEKLWMNYGLSTIGHTHGRSYSCIKPIFSLYMK